MSNGITATHVGDGHELAVSNQEEADSRIAHHLSHALEYDSDGEVLIVTGDTDVIVVLACQVRDILQPENVWIYFGRGEYKKTCNLDFIRKNIGPEECHALPIFHCLTGCDTVSGFRGRGKATFWKVWRKFSDITETFLELTFGTPKPLEGSEKTFEAIQRFIIQAYDSSSTEQDTNEARASIFV